MLKPSRSNQSWTEALSNRQPDGGHCYGIVRNRHLRSERMIVNALRGLVTAAVRRWHSHLLALEVHHPAACLLSRSELRIRK